MANTFPSATVKHLEDGTVVILDVIKNHTAGTNAVQSDLTQIAVTVTRVKDVNGAAVSVETFGPSNLTIASVIFDTLQTWGDGTEYNYKHVVPDTAFAEPGTYKYKCHITAVGGTKYWGPRVTHTVDDVEGI